MSDPKSLAIVPIVPTDLGGFADLAARFSKSSLLPEALRAKPDDVFVTLLAGHELGLPPMAALRGIHVVKGKPILTADTMVALVLSRGAARYFRCVEESDTSVTYETLREGSPEPQRSTWTIADAKRAGLTGGNWVSYPRAMLKARCKSVLARDVYPDVLAGCYEEGEADEINGGPSVMQALPTMKRADAAPPVADHRAKADVTAPFDFAVAIATAKTLDALTAIGARIAALTDDEKAAIPVEKQAAIKSSYAARLAVLNGPDPFAAFLADLGGMLGSDCSTWTVDDVVIEFVEMIGRKDTLAEVNAAALPWVTVASKPGRGQQVRAVKAAIEQAAEARRAELRAGTAA